MTWFVWLVIIVAVAAITFTALLLIQVRRRRGGVIVDPARSPRTAKRGARR